MHFCYGVTDGNSIKARSLYAEKYSNKAISSAKILCKIDQRLQDITTLKPAERILENSRNRTLCEWMSRKIQCNSNFLVRILFTNETIFNKYGITNNEDFSARENLHALRDGSCREVQYRILLYQRVHTFYQMQMHLIGCFKNRWIGRKGPALWSARSPVLNNRRISTRRVSTRRVTSKQVNVQFTFAKRRVWLFTTLKTIVFFSTTCTR